MLRFFAEDSALQHHAPVTLSRGMTFEDWVGVTAEHFPQHSQFLLSLNTCICILH